jgi:hypothetical protein
MILLTICIWTSVQQLPGFAPGEAPGSFLQSYVKPAIVIQLGIHVVIKRGAPFVPVQFRARDNANPPGEVPVFATGFVNADVVGDYIVSVVAVDLPGNVTLQRVAYHVRE